MTYDLVERLKEHRDRIRRTRSRSIDHEMALYLDHTINRIAALTKSAETWCQQAQDFHGELEAATAALSSLKTEVLDLLEPYIRLRLLTALSGERIAALHARLSRASDAQSNDGAKHETGEG